MPMVLHQGAMVATLHSHPCQLFDTPLPFDALVQGSGATYARDWIFAEDLGINDLAEARTYVESKVLSKTARRLDMEQIWRPGYRDTGSRAPREHLDALLAEYSAPDDLAAVLDYFAIRERCRKFLNKAIVIIRASREAYFPYLDHEFIETMISIPISERVNNRVRIDLIERLCPTLLDVPSSSNLIPLSASPGRIWMIRAYRGVKRRASRRLGFIGRDPIKVPNHYYAQWTRNEMRPTLVKFLYNPNAAFRTYLRWDTVEPLLNQHFAGESNWQSLVAGLTVFEIAHRLWVDTP
jgi:asparagine synthetase B (glutamine-hydrolysing)